MSFSHKDQTRWPVYITIKNLDANTRQSHKRLGILLLGSIPIVHKRSEDTNNKDKDLKAKIYHMALKTMLQRIYPNLSSIDFKKKETPMILQHCLNINIELVCADSYKRRYYPILVGFMVDYEEQVLNAGIKANMQYSIYHISQKKRELITRS